MKKAKHRDKRAEPSKLYSVRDERTGRFRDILRSKSGKIVRVKSYKIELNKLKGGKRASRKADKIANQPSKIYAVRDRAGHFTGVIATKSGKTVLTSPAKSKTGLSSWHKAFSSPQRRK